MIFAALALILALGAIGPHAAALGPDTASTLDSAYWIVPPGGAAIHALYEFDIGPPAPAIAGTESAYSRTDTAAIGTLAATKPPGTDLGPSSSTWTSTLTAKYITYYDVPGPTSYRADDIALAPRLIRA